MNKYFQAFKEKISWFNNKNEPIEVFEIEEFGLTNSFKEIFQMTSELIQSSIKTGIELGEKSLILFSWEVEGEICGWLCQFDRPSIDLIPAHQILIDNIGGITQSYNGPSSVELNGINYNYVLTLNQDFMFVGSECANELDSVAYYLERCEEINVEPIKLFDQVFFTKEGNGAKYFYDRNTKVVKLFSHDNAFTFVEAIPNQPERTMYNIKGVKTFEDFVELLSMQWNKYFELKKR